MNERDSAPPWHVLLLGGASATGKSTAAAALGRQLGVPWLLVDDLRLAVQYGGLLTPEHQPDLFYFLQLDDVRHEPPERLLSQLLTVGDLMAGAIRIVTSHHTATRKQVIIEGDGIAPAIAAELQGETVRVVYLIEQDEEHIYRNMRARERGIAAVLTPEAEAAVRAWVRLAWLHNQWLETEARRYGLPVVLAQPYDTLIERIVAAITPRSPDTTP